MRLNLEYLDPNLILLYDLQICFVAQQTHLWLQEKISFSHSG